ncbi:hypothetical protein LDENG_00231630 [Lucifuga dentata]|nr:hypothetical protein LDENG_00231630 [Lucifuga dentata]
MCFDYDISYRVGVQNHSADCLSRLPLPTTPEMDSDTEPELVALLSTVLTAVTQSEFEAASSACPEMTVLSNQITHGWPPSAAAVSPELKPYYRLRNELTVKDSIVFRDNGCQLTSDAFTSFLKERQIKHICSSLYHAASSGTIERFNRVLKGSIQSAILESKPWKQTVTDFLHIYRATPHAAIGVSPFELLHGRRMCTKLNVLPAPPVTGKVDTEVRQRVSLRQAKMKAYTDTKRGVRTPSFKEGDKVRIRKQLHVPKGHPKYTLPVEIKKQVGLCTYVMSDGKTWHASHLTSVPSTQSNPVPVKQPPDTPAQSDTLETPPRVRPDTPAHSHTQKVTQSLRRRPGWLSDYQTD